MVPEVLMLTFAVSNTRLIRAARALLHMKFHSCSVKEQLIIASVFRQMNDLQSNRLIVSGCTALLRGITPQSDGEHWGVVEQRLSTSISLAVVDDIGRVLTRHILTRAHMHTY